MTYPLSTKSRDTLFTDVHEKYLPQLKRAMTTHRNTLASVSVNGQAVIGGVLPLAKDATLRLNEAIVRTDLQDFARQQINDLAYDWIGQITAIRNQCQVIVDWIIANAPQTGGYLDFQTINPDGTVTDRMFAPAAFTDLVTEIDALLALMTG